MRPTLIVASSIILKSTAILTGHPAPNAYSSAEPIPLNCDRTCLKCAINPFLAGLPQRRLIKILITNETDDRCFSIRNSSFLFFMSFEGVMDGLRAKAKGNRIICKIFGLKLHPRLNQR
jgi:hypothetical protein